MTQGTGGRGPDAGPGDDDVRDGPGERGEGAPGPQTGQDEGDVVPRNPQDDAADAVGDDGRTGGIPEAPVIQIAASPLRRGMATAVLVGLGGLLLWVAVVSWSGAAGGSGDLFRLALAVIGAGAVLAALRLRQATQACIVLSALGVSDDAGRVLAPLDNILGVDRGPFAFKPSNGFALRLARAMPAGWAPGLWWRFGRRLGVGGVLGRAETKAMAEMLTMMLADRAAGRDPRHRGRQDD